jgi:hypothetical protein
MEWVSRNTFVWGDKLSRGTFGLIRERALGFVFGMIFGVGIDLLRRRSLGYSTLPGSRKRQ